jgi:hypothetical protein
VRRANVRFETTPVDVNKPPYKLTFVHQYDKDDVFGARGYDVVRTRYAELVRRAGVGARNMTATHMSESFSFCGVKTPELFFERLVQLADGVELTLELLDKIIELAELHFYIGELACTQVFTLYDYMIPRIGTFVYVETITK